MNFNSITVLGRLTADTELRTTTTGIPVVTFTVAVNRYDKNDTTDFIKCTAFRETAERIHRDGYKGLLVLVNGSLQSSTYESKNGSKITDWYVSVITFRKCEKATESKKSSETGITDVVTNVFEKPDTEFESDLPF